MALVASLLLVLVLAASVVALVVYRRSLRDDDTTSKELPPDLLIALGRAHDAARAGPTHGRDADASSDYE